MALRRLTNRSLGEKVGVNPGTLGRVLNGYVEPWPALRARCAEALGLPEDQLFHDDDSKVAL